VWSRVHACVARSAPHTQARVHARQCTQKCARTHAHIRAQAGPTAVGLTVYGAPDVVLSRRAQALMGGF